MCLCKNHMLLVSKKHTVNWFKIYFSNRVFLNNLKNNFYQTYLVVHPKALLWGNSFFSICQWHVAYYQMWNFSLCWWFISCLSTWSYSWKAVIWRFFGYLQNTDSVNTDKRFVIFCIFGRFNRFRGFEEFWGLGGRFRS